MAAKDWSSHHLPCRSSWPSSGWRLLPLSRLRKSYIFGQPLIDDSIESRYHHFTMETEFDEMPNDEEECKADVMAPVGDRCRIYIFGCVDNVLNKLSRLQRQPISTSFLYSTRSEVSAEFENTNLTRVATISLNTHNIILLRRPLTLIYRNRKLDTKYLIIIYIGIISAFNIELSITKARY